MTERGMNYTIALTLEDSVHGIFLFSGSSLVGGWMDQPEFPAARIAAEVLKVALPDANVIPMPMRVNETLEWWKGIQIFSWKETLFSKATTQTPPALPEANVPSPSSEF